VKISVIRKWTLVLALISIGRFLSVSLLQVLYPVDLIFESPTWNTALLLHRGVNIYSTQTYDAPPFNLNLYTPLYFAVVSIIPGFSQAPLVVGRTVSLFFAFCCLAVLIVTTSRKNRLPMGVIGIGWLLLFSPVLVNAAFFRMEFMALFFSACAVGVLRTGATSKIIVAAAFFSCLAVMSKQTSVAAPVACFIYLLWNNRRQGFQFAVFFSLLLGLCLFYLYRSSGEGFLWSILVAPKQPLRFEWFTYNLGYMSTPSFFALLGLSAAAFYAILASLKTRGSSSGATRPDLLNAVYYLTSWVWLFASIGKLGASTNYFIEPLFASVWLLLIWVDTQKQDLPAPRIYRYALILLPLVFTADAFITRKEPHYLLTPTLNSPERFQRIKQEMESIGVPASPKILNLGQATHSLSVGWDLYLNDPVLYMLLWNNGVLSNRSLLKTIDEGYFDLIAVPAAVRRQPKAQQLRPMQEIFQRVFERYELKSELTFDYYVPRRKSGFP
jgi:hypothetical protein